MSRRNSKQKQRKQQKRKQQRKQQQHASRGARQGKPDLDALDLRVRNTELAHPPIHVDANGLRTADPFACLGLDPDVPPNREAVQAAFRAALAETPPESDPQRARELREARDLLLDPGQALTRTLGDLRVPRPEEFVPGHESHRAPSSAPRARAAATEWSSRTRLVALMTLAALLEEELRSDAGP